MPVSHYHTNGFSVWPNIFKIPIICIKQCRHYPFGWILGNSKTLKRESLASLNKAKSLLLIHSLPPYRSEVNGLDWRRSYMMRLLLDAESSLCHTQLGTLQFHSPQHLMYHGSRISHLDLDCCSLRVPQLSRLVKHVTVAYDGFFWSCNQHKWRHRQRVCFHSCP